MNENHQLVKNVSNALNYYMNIRRREESFDTRLVNNKPKRISSSLVIPSINKKNPMSFKLKNVPNDDIKVREQFFKDELNYHLGWNRSRRFVNRSESVPHKLPSSANRESSANMNQSRTSLRIKNKQINSFLPTEDVNSSHVIRREKKEMIDLTSRILTVTSELCFSKRDLALLKSLSNKKHSTGHSVCYKQLVRRQPPPIREEEPTSASEYGAGDTENGSGMARVSMQEKKEDYESRPECKSGPTIVYTIVIKTSDRLGSSSEADIFLQIFGTNGKSKILALNKSLCHKIPFRRANVDVFEYKCYDLGKIDAIKIGHNEQDVEYSWFVDYVRVEDHKSTVSYNFVCNDWFSVKSADRKTMRILVKQSETRVISDIDNTSFANYSNKPRSVKRYSSSRSGSTSLSSASESELTQARSSYTESTVKPVETSKKKPANRSRSSSSSHSSSSSRSRQLDSPKREEKKSSTVSSKEKSSRATRSSSSSSSSRSRQRINTTETEKTATNDSKKSRNTRLSSSSSSSRSRPRISSNESGKSQENKSPPQSNKQSNETKKTRSPSSSSSDARTNHSTGNNNKATTTLNKEKKASSRSSSSRGSSSSSISSKPQRKLTFSDKPTDSKTKKSRDSEAAFTSSKRDDKSAASRATRSSSESSLSDSSENSSFLSDGSRKKKKKPVRVTTASSSDTNRISRPKTKSPMNTVKSVNSVNMSSFEAVKENRLDALKEAISSNKQKEIKSTDNKGNTLMSVACEHGHVSIVKYLAELDQSLIDKENKLGYTPVHLCAKYNHLDCLKVLYDYRATLQLRTHVDGYTPLHLAAAEGHLEIVKWLCEKKINLNNQDDRSRTALKLAREKDQTNVVEYLESLELSL